MFSIKACPFVEAGALQGVFEGVFVFTPYGVYFMAGMW
jgi:hypothetical protein